MPRILMRIIALFFIFVTYSSIASDQAIEIMNAAPSECKSDFINYQKELANGYLAHQKKHWLDDIDQLLKIRRSLISEGAINSQVYFDELLARKVLLLFSQNDLLIEQRSRISDIKEIFMTYPLKGSNQQVTNLNSKFEAFGI
jgi:hypothetical protein